MRQTKLFIITMFALFLMAGCSDSNVEVMDPSAFYEITLPKTRDLQVVEFTLRSDPTKRCVYLRRFGSSSIALQCFDAGVSSDMPTP